MNTLTNKTLRTINMAISGYPKISAALRTHTSLDGLLTAIHAAHHELDDTYLAAPAVVMRRYFIGRYGRNIEKYIMEMLLADPAALGNFNSVYLNNFLDQINARLGLMGKPRLEISSNCTGTPVRFDWSKMSTDAFKRSMSINDLIDNKANANSLFNNRGTSKSNMQQSFYQRMLNEKVIQDNLQSFNATEYIGTASATTASPNDISADAVAAVFDMLKAK